MTEEKTLSSRRVFDGRAVNLRVDTVQTADGRETTREIVEHSDCVAIIPIDDKDNVLLVNQFREAVGKELLEIPAGGIDNAEGPEDAGPQTRPVVVVTEEQLTAVHIVEVNDGIGVEAQTLGLDSIGARCRNPEAHPVLVTARAERMQLTLAIGHDILRLAQVIICLPGIIVTR